MRILVIEDEQELADALLKGLSLKGYAVDSALDGAQGYQKAMDQQYDLIVLDLNLPGMDGLSLLKQLKQEKPESKVLILFSKPSFGDKAFRLYTGASDY